MKTKKQEEMINTFLSPLSDELRPLYQDIIMYLSGLGYNPYKQRANIVFKHDLHNKQMAKIGIHTSKDKAPFFALRFSACTGYSKRFEDIVADHIEKCPARAARCPDDGCGFCKGNAMSHVYTHTFPGGETKTNCGAYALEIPDIKKDDIIEIKELINQEHEYLMEHEAGA